MVQSNSAARSATSLFLLRPIPTNEGIAPLARRLARDSLTAARTMPDRLESSFLARLRKSFSKTLSRTIVTLFIGTPADVVMLSTIAQIVKPVAHSERSRCCLTGL
jgi:hypothetical protein